MEDALETVRDFLSRVPFLSRLEGMIGKGRRKGVTLLVIALSAILIISLFVSTWDHLFAPEKDRAGHVQAIQFYYQDNASREEAERLCRDDGGRISTADEVHHAWERHGAEAYAYGRLADDRFAVVVQHDFHNYQKGANIGAKGGNQGVWCSFDD